MEYIWRVYCFTGVAINFLHILDTQIVCQYNFEHDSSLVPISSVRYTLTREEGMGTRLDIGAL